MDPDVAGSSPVIHPITPRALGFERMRVTVETTDELARRATVAVPSAKFEAEVAASLKEAASGLKLPGFRPGKVPMQEVRRRLDTTVRNQVARNLAIASFSDAMREQPFTLATQAQIQIVNLDPGRDLEFTATFEVLPEVQLAALDSLLVRQPRTTIEEADIDFTIEVIRRQRREWVAVGRPAQEGDRVVLDLARDGREDAEKDEKDKGLTFVLDEQMRLEQWRQAIIGLAANDKGQLPSFPPAQSKTETALDADTPAALRTQAPPAVVDGLAGDADTAAQTGPSTPDASLGTNDAAPHADRDAAAQEAGDQEDVLAEPAAADAEPAAADSELVSADSEPTHAVEFTLRSVEAPVLPDVDDALFDWFGVEAGADRLTKFRAAVRDRMEVELQAAIRRATGQEVLAALVAAHEFALPPTLVRTAVTADLERLAEVVTDITPEVTAATQEGVERRLRAQLVMGEIISRQSMTPDDKRVTDRIDEIASAYEEPAQVRRAIFADENRMREIEKTVLEEQVIESVLAHAQVAPVDMPYQDLVAGRALPERPAATAESTASAAESTASEEDDQQSTAEAPAAPGAVDESSGLLGKVKRLFAK